MQEIARETNALLHAKNEVFAGALHRAGEGCDRKQQELLHAKETLKAEVAVKRKLALEAKVAREAALDAIHRLQNDNSQKDEALKVAHCDNDRLLDKNSVMDKLICNFRTEQTATRTEVAEMKKTNALLNAKNEVLAGALQQA